MAHRHLFPLSNTTLPAPAFKAPASKNAHHLHSIPPREKSTRTLIVDHMLWMHGRARFSQARAELGMTPLAENEYDADSDGENIVTLRYGLQDRRQQIFPDGEEEMRPFDITKARGFKSKADGLEKVLSAMLDQPPEVLPADQDELTSNTPTTPIASLQSLPNGVRFRLALAALINDFFCRSPDYGVATPTSPTTSSDSSLISIPQFPPTLLSIAQSMSAKTSFSSGQSIPLPTLPPFRTLTSSPPTLSLSLSTSHLSTPPRSSDPKSMHSRGSSVSSPTTRLPPASSLLPRNPTWSTSPPELTGPMIQDCRIRIRRASGRSRDLYQEGAVPQTSDRTRCLRHLQLGCMGCATTSFGSTTIGSGLSRVSGPPLRRPCARSCIADLLPSFIRISALVAIELSRETRGDDLVVDLPFEGSLRGPGPYGPYREEPLDSSAFSPSWSSTMSSSRTSPVDSDSEDAPTSRKGSRQSTRSSFSSFGLPNCDLPSLRPPRYYARPTREWYALLAGLLTRAVLEGYLVRNWKGPEAAEVLLSVGLGVTGSYNRRGGPSSSEGSNEAITDYDPDDIPSIEEAGKILFWKSHRGSVGREPLDFTGRVGRRPEEEFEIEMEERMSEFLNVPLQTSDLCAHLEDLCNRYPAEPIERAALRFFEAVALWRGKPELETYKNPSQPTSPSQPNYPSSSFSPSIPIPSLLLQPSPSRPSIEKYYTLPPQRCNIRTITGSKRPRDFSPSDSMDEDRRTGKKISRQGWVDDWPGPYGL